MAGKPDFELSYDQNSGQAIRSGGAKFHIDSDTLRRAGFRRPANFHLLPATSPIVDALVDDLAVQPEVKRISRSIAKVGGECALTERPQWISARIDSSNIDMGQTNNECPYLAAIVRRRGKPGDECGHMLGCSLGGPILHFNLFPQDVSINKGRKDLHCVWRKIETRIKKWITTKTSDFGDPFVKFELRLFYGDPVHPDRPINFRVNIGFYGTIETQRNAEVGAGESFATWRASSAGLSRRSVALIDSVDRLVENDCEYYKRLAEYEQLKVENLIEVFDNTIKTLFKS